MTAFLHAVFFVLLAITPAAEAADVQGDWAKAVQWIEDGRNWLPGRIDTKVTEKDKRGELVSVEVLEMVMRREGADSVLRKLVRAINGRSDVTEARREKVEGLRTYAEHIAHQREKDLTGNPFAKVAQEHMTVTDLQVQETINGRLCRKVGFLRKVKRKEIFQGWAWLDVETAKPVYAEVEVLDRPMFAKSLRSVIQYGDVGEGAWGAKTLKITGYGGMLGMYRYFDTEMKMSVYWLLK